jgi:hypothetical protein
MSLFYRLLRRRLLYRRASHGPPPPVCVLSKSNPKTAIAATGRLRPAVRERSDTMSLEDTLDRPTAPQAALSDPQSAWVTVGTCPQMAAMNNYPVALQRDGVLYVISGGDGGDTVLTSDDDGVTWNPPQTGDWPVRRALSAALHDGKFYIVGGFSPGQGFGDTLVSDDGLHFTQSGAYPSPWGVRWAHTLLSTGDKLLMIAGVSGPDYSNEVWALGADDAWSKIAEGQFTKRAWAAGAVLGSTLMVIGGWNDADGAFAETLVSDDGGVNWTAYPFPPGFTARHSACAVTIGDTVFLVGGCTGRPGTEFYADTWATKDGIYWTRVDATFRPIGRTFAAAALDGKVAVIGSSADVIALTRPPLGWSEAPQPSPDASSQNMPRTAELNGTYYAFGGGSPSGKVCASNDGLSWANLTHNLPARYNMAGTVHDGRLIASGGSDSGGNHNDVFTSTDGHSWNPPPPPPGVPFTPARQWHCMASFLGKLWLFGGDALDVWRSENDGHDWEQKNPQAFDRWVRYGTPVVLRDKLWVLTADDTNRGQAYSTPDGINWTSHQPPWSFIYSLRAVAVGTTLYVLGNNVASGVLEIWATATPEEPASWQLIDNAAPYPALHQFGAVAVNDTIVVLGGLLPSGRSAHVLRSRPAQFP